MEQLILASILCQDLAMDLDAGSIKKVRPIGAVLMDFPAEIILLAVRRHIQIERLVRHDMDEDPIFMRVLTKVNRGIEDEQ